jgi:hypothetical protein
MLLARTNIVLNHGRAMALAGRLRTSIVRRQPDYGGSAVGAARLVTASQRRR